MFPFLSHLNRNDHPISLVFGFKVLEWLYTEAEEKVVAGRGQSFV
jgi:hypothetical protein